MMRIDNTQKQWALKDLTKLYHEPLLEIVSQAHKVHQENHPAFEIELCHLDIDENGRMP